MTQPLMMLAGACTCHQPRCGDMADPRTSNRPNILTLGESALLKDRVLLNELADPVDENTHLGREMAVLGVHH